MSKIIGGTAFYKSLPKELRDKLPSQARRIVLDIPHDGGVRMICETFVDRDIALPLLEAALRVEIDIDVHEVPVTAGDDPYGNTLNEGNVSDEPARE